MKEGGRAMMTLVMKLWKVTFQRNGRSEMSPYALLI